MSRDITKQTSADAQADLSLRWPHIHFVGFVMSRLILQMTLTATYMHIQGLPRHIIRKFSIMKRKEKYQYSPCKPQSSQGFSLLCQLEHEVFTTYQL